MANRRTGIRTPGQGKSWGPKGKTLSRATVARIDRAEEKRERQEGKKEAVADDDDDCDDEWGNADFMGWGD